MTLARKTWFAGPMDASGTAATGPSYPSYEPTPSTVAESRALYITTGDSSPLWSEPASTAPTTVSDLRERDEGYLGLEAWRRTIDNIARLRTPDRPGSDVGSAVERIRVLTGLSLASIADLLGVARRSLYNWSTGETRPRQASILLGLLRTLETFAAAAEPWELATWLQKSDAIAAIRQGDWAALGRLLDDGLNARSIHRLTVAGPDFREEVEPLDRNSMREFLQAATQTRPVRLTARRPPRELTDSELEDDAR